MRRFPPLPEPEDNDLMRERMKRLESENAALKKMIGEWAEEIGHEARWLSAFAETRHNLAGLPATITRLAAVAAKMREAAK